MKLQPNFSFQKYQVEGMTSEEQFQYRMQQEHIVVGNSVNATIDDCSHFERERQTSFTWIDGRPIWTKTLPTQAWTGVGTINTIPLGITGDFELIDFQAFIQDGTTAASNTIFLPYLDVAVAANEIMIQRTGTNIILTSGGTDYSAYSGYVTIFFLKPKS